MRPERLGRLADTVRRINVRGQADTLSHPRLPRVRCSGFVAENTGAVPSPAAPARIRVFWRVFRSRRLAGTRSGRDLPALMRLGEV